MGRGNVCVYGKYEGLYYVDYENLYMYSKKEAFKTEEDPDDEVRFGREISYHEQHEWQYEEILSEHEYEWMVGEIQEGMCKRFRSMVACDKLIGHRREEWAILENGMFYVTVEDNQWSVAVKLIQKEFDYEVVEGLQKRHYQTYLKAIRDILFEMFDEIGTYGGAWTSGTLRKQEIA